LEWAERWSRGEATERATPPRGRLRRHLYSRAPPRPAAPKAGCGEGSAAAAGSLEPIPLRSAGRLLDLYGRLGGRLRGTPRSLLCRIRGWSPPCPAASKTGGDEVLAAEAGSLESFPSTVDRPTTGSLPLRPRAGHPRGCRISDDASVKTFHPVFFPRSIDLSISKRLQALKWRLLEGWKRQTKLEIRKTREGVAG
jgi:hypothetical protein